MWAETVDLLEQAERLQRQFFRLATAGTREQPQWEPPVDVYASEDQVLVEVALPGVPLERMELAVGAGEIVDPRRAAPAAAPGGPRASSGSRFPTAASSVGSRSAPGTGNWSARNRANGCLQLLLARR